MYVSTDHALSFSKLEASFGVPVPTSGMVEVFGVYCGPYHWCYWSFNPRTQIWARHEIGYSRVAPEYDGILDEDREPYRKASDWLAELAPPALPDDRTMPQREGAFLYMGFLFQWLFIPELGRWEMLPLGRYDGTTSQN